MIKLLAKGVIALVAFLFFGFLFLRNGNKVKKIEKMCDRLRENQRLVMSKAVECSKLVMETETDTSKIYKKLKPLCYQQELGGDQTIFFCKNIDEKSFYLVTIYGDVKLVPLNYKVVLDDNSNKVRIFADDQLNENNFVLGTDFSHRLLKFCAI